MPFRIFKDMKIKLTLKKKWLAILRYHIHIDLGKIITDFFNIKFEAKETIKDFAIRRQDVWENLARYSYIMNNSLWIK